MSIPLIAITQEPAAGGRLRIPSHSGGRWPEGPDQAERARFLGTIRRPRAGRSLLTFPLREKKKVPNDALLRALTLAFMVWGNLAWCQESSLRLRLEALTQQAGITVSGLDVIGSEPARDDNGDLPDRLRLLLQDYNYLVINDGRGGIERLVITSLKQSGKKWPASAYVNTKRAGVHHQVEAVILGPGGTPHKLTLIVDTGASTIVLPASLQDELGFKGEDLEAGWSRTASGLVAVKMGNLRSVQVGNATADDVRVAFVSDRRLGDVMLLGMSFLERFRMILDDARDEMVLEPR